MAGMDVSPQAVAAATFKTVKKGFDPDEVRAFLAKIAVNLESSQQHGAAMEARARAAIAKMQELAQQASHATPPPPAEPVAAPQPAAADLAAGTDEAATISRTLLLAQRTADLTISDASAEADAIRSAARTDADAVLDAARAEAARLIEAARAEAREAKDSEVASADEAVQSLIARRDFLLGDVEHLEQHVVAQRDRLRDAIASLQDLVERVPGGLGDVRRPLLSASAPEPEPTVGDAAVEVVEVDEVDELDAGAPDPAAAVARPEPTAPVDATPVEQQLRFERAQPESFRIGGEEL